MDYNALFRDVTVSRSELMDVAALIVFGDYVRAIKLLEEMADRD